MYDFASVVSIAHFNQKNDCASRNCGQDGGQRGDNYAKKAQSRCHQVSRRPRIGSEKVNWLSGVNILNNG